MGDVDGCAAVDVNDDRIVTSAQLAVPNKHKTFTEAADHGGIRLNGGGFTERGERGTATASWSRVKSSDLDSEQL